MGLPLSLNDLNKTYPEVKTLSVVMYWKQKTGNDNFQNGHAALIMDVKEVINKPSTLTHYVSWLGDGDRPGKNPFVRFGKAASYVSDREEWGGALVKGNHRVPTRWVAVKNLDLGKMVAKWDSMHSRENAHWKMVDKNCATSVARVLKAGGADQYATKAKHQLVWWPTDLITYATSMGTSVVCTSSNFVPAG